MKKKILIIIGSFFCQNMAFAVDLIEVYQQALTSDPLFQQAISQRLATKEGVPINLAALLPTITMSVNPSVTRSGYAGAITAGIGVQPRNNTLRAYDLNLTATQTVFNYTQFASLAGSIATSKGADALLNASLQNLMVRVASAYFAVLKDEENLSYSEATKIAYAEQLDQVKEQYDVGLKTITDVYTAQASYDASVANYIAAQTTLNNDRENLRVITGKYYPHLSTLSDSFPLISPHPQDVETWVHTSQTQNWSIKAAQYVVDTSKIAIQQQFGGHLPTVSLQGSMDRIYTSNNSGYNTLVVREGPSMEVDRAVAINISFPIFAGGGVVAQTNQAAYNYQVSQQQLEQVIRNTTNTTRQSYLGIIAGISQIQADKQTIKSSMSSLEGMEASYKVGTETLVDVLDQQQKVFRAQTQYATDRYAFVNNILALKQSAGTLGFEDLRAINAWLIDKEIKTVSRKPLRAALIHTHKNKTKHLTHHKKANKHIQTAKLKKVKQKTHHA